jgi:hypothetical protein
VGDGRGALELMLQSSEDAESRVLLVLEVCTRAMSKTHRTGTRAEFR